MPDESEPYGSWSAIAQAIKTAATKAARTRGARDVTTQIRQAQFDRFLSRVFADGNESEWLLKGGVGMLARVPQARATQDIDLSASRAVDLDTAVQALQEAAGHDLGDHLRFALTRTIATGLGDNQPDVQTRRAVFTCTDADTGRRIGEIPIDIVVGPPPVGTVETIEPAHRLALSRPLAAHPYRVFPIADQIAEKVCATLYDKYPSGRRSSRVKDLVDLVVITRTQTINLRELQLAITAKQTASAMPPITTFTIPDDWQREYRRLAAQTADAGDITDAFEAAQHVADFLTPALDTSPLPPDVEWTPRPRPATQRADQPGEVWVQQHLRSGMPVTGHWRRRRGH